VYPTRPSTTRLKKSFWSCTESWNNSKGEPNSKPGYSASPSTPRSTTYAVSVLAVTDVEAEASPAQSTPHDELAKRQAVEVLYRLLDQLEPAKRTVFVMADLEQMSAPEIASVLDVPLNTVYSRLRVARQEFDENLRRHKAATDGAFHG
jgi:RNA polymerase sigma factor (sigma-70 family)